MTSRCLPAIGPFHRHGKVVVVAAPQESVAAQFRAAGVIVCQPERGDGGAGPVGGARGVARQPVPVTRAKNVHPGEARRAQCRPETRSFSDEAASLGFLHAQGLPTVPNRLCRPQPTCARRCVGSVAPVVSKACDECRAAQSEHGLVVLNVQHEDEATDAFARLENVLASLGRRGDVLVAPMITGRWEVMLGARVDPVFGPTIMVGDGGKYVEVYNDVQLLMPPVTMDEARAAIRRLRIAPFFSASAARRRSISMRSAGPSSHSARSSRRARTRLRPST